MAQEITITNVKTAVHKPINVNEIFDPGVEHNTAYEFEKCTVAAPFMGNQLMVAAYVLQPGKSNYPYHYHAGMEEVFYIISGHGLLETPKGNITVTEGDVIVMPIGENGAHRLSNPSEDTPLVYLDVDTHTEPEVVFYPRTNKLMVMSDQYKKSFKVDTEVNYLAEE